MPNLLRFRVYFAMNLQLARFAGVRTSEIFATSNIHSNAVCDPLCVHLYDVCAGSPPELSHAISFGRSAFNSRDSNLYRASGTVVPFREDYVNIYTTSEIPSDFPTAPFRSVPLGSEPTRSDSIQTFSRDGSRILSRRKAVNCERDRSWRRPCAAGARSLGLRNPRVALPLSSSVCPSFSPPPRGTNEGLPCPFFHDRSLIPSARNAVVTKRPRERCNLDGEIRREL